MKNVPTAQCCACRRSVASGMVALVVSDMDERVRAAYIDHLMDLASRGIIDDSLTDIPVEGRTVEERIIDALREAGKLPADVEQELRERRTA